MRLSAPRHRWSITPTTKNRAGNLGLRGASPHRRSERIEGYWRKSRTTPEVTE
jgi:hypothetical protein